MAVNSCSCLVSSFLTTSLSFVLTVMLVAARELKAASADVALTEMVSIPESPTTALSGALTWTHWAVFQLSAVNARDAGVRLMAILCLTTLRPTVAGADCVESAIDTRATVRGTCRVRRSRERRGTAAAVSVVAAPHAKRLADNLRRIADL